MFMLGGEEASTAYVQAGQAGRPAVTRPGPVPSLTWSHCNFDSNDVFTKVFFPFPFHKCIFTFSSFMA